MNWRKPIILLLLKLSGSRISHNINVIKKLYYTNTNEKYNYQQTALERLLEHAYKNVPYYKQLFDNQKIVIQKKVLLEKFDKIPILTKKIIRKRFEDLKSRTLYKRKWYFNTSGGSTGEPVKFIQDNFYSDWNIANKIHIKMLARQNIGSREIRLWGSERDILKGKENLKVRLQNFLYNRIDLNSFKIEKKDFHKFLTIWNRFKPTWVEAYVQSIFEFSKYIKKNKIKIHSPKGILTTAGTLYSNIKSEIETIFNCPVFNRYGSREVGDIGCSNHSNELVLNPWNHYIEILDKNYNHVNPGEKGKIYVTTLNNYSMPLIRYDIGDFAVKSEKKFQIKSIQGREVNFFRTKNNE
jgi:phenylacetate-CoA ligase